MLNTSARNKNGPVGRKTKAVYPYDEYVYHAGETVGVILVFNLPKKERRLEFQSYRVEDWMDSEEIAFRKATLKRIYRRLRLKCRGIQDISEVKEEIRGEWKKKK